MDAKYSTGPLDLWRLAGIPLVITTLGAAVPYGESDPTANNLTLWEWILTGMFAVAFIILFIAMIRRHGRGVLLSLGYLVTGFAWMVNTLYEFLTEQNTFLDSLGRNPVYPAAKKGLVAPLGFKNGDFSQPQGRDVKGNPPVPVDPVLIDRYIIHHTGTTADQLDYFSYMNDRSSCPTWYLRTDGSIFEMIRPHIKPAASGASWNYRSLATETQNSTGDPTWEVTDAQLEAHAQIIAWIMEFDGKELDGIPVSFAIDRTHVIGHNETGFQTDCPGPYLYPRLDDIVKRAQAIWDEKHPPQPDPDGVVITEEFVQAQIDLWTGLLEEN